MGQKVHPFSFRLGQLYTWKSKWFSQKKNFREQLKEDILLREFLKEKLKNCAVAEIEIERFPKMIVFTIKTSRPGMVIGQKGEKIEKIKNELKKKLSKKIDLKLNIEEIKFPQLSAQLAAEAIAKELEKRFPFRKVVKRALEKIISSGALGAKIIVSGRLDGVDISRKERFIQKKLPLHTIRADIDFGKATALTSHGTVGVKVWVYKGEILEK